MKLKKIILVLIAAALLIAAVKDLVHFTKGPVDNPVTVQPATTFAANEGKTIIMVYNAYNGIYPAAVDYVKKNFFPKSYPCNLCLLAFGNNGPLPQWTAFLDSLPYKQMELHKEDFKNNFVPSDLPLPVIMLANDAKTEVLVSAAEINECKSLGALISLVKSKL